MSTPMSESLPHPSTSPAATQAATPSRPHWLREPLLHFVLLGALVFAADHVLLGKTDDTKTIVMGAAVDAEARKVFSDARGHAPNDKELAALRQTWLDNEVLYREGLALRLDKGDPTIRERVIFKSLMAIEPTLRLPPIDEPKLREWFEARRAKYDQPPRYDFEEAVLPGTPTEAELNALVQTLNAGPSGSTQAQTEASLRVFKGRPLENLRASYGEDFGKALATGEPGIWRVLPTSSGPRAMRLESVTALQPADFEAVRNVVRQDWVDTTMAELRTSAVREMAKKYTLQVEGTSK